MELLEIVESPQHLPIQVLGFDLEVDRLEQNDLGLLLVLLDFDMMAFVHHVDELQLVDQIQRDRLFNI